MQTTSFNIKNETKGKLPRLPFARIKNHVLGEEYELSLVFVGDSVSKKLNFSYRGKNKPTNVLSFPLSDTEGEVFINLKKAREEAVEWNMPFSNFVGLLFIHGLFHLKGFEHGSTMDSEEAKVRTHFKI